MNEYVIAFVGWNHGAAQLRVFCKSVCALVSCVKSSGSDLEVCLPIHTIGLLFLRNFVTRVSQYYVGLVARELTMQDQQTKPPEPAPDLRLKFPCLAKGLVCLPPGSAKLVKQV